MIYIYIIIIYIYIYIYMMPVHIFMALWQKSGNHFLHFGCVPISSDIFSLSLPLSLSHSFTLFLTLSNSLFIIDTCGIQN